MMRITALAIALTFVTAGTALSQADVAGQIVRIEPEQQVIVLSNGQMYRVTTGTTILLDNQPVRLGGLRPGHSVVIRSGEPVTLQNGQYVVMGGTTVTQVPAPPTNVIVAPPATAVPAGVRQTLYGRIDRVDDDGEVKIAVDDDTFKVRLSRDMARQLREGDRVQIDMTVVPPGTPAASPQTR